MSQEQGQPPRDAEVTESKIRESGALENCVWSYICGEAGIWGGMEEKERVVMNMKVGDTPKVNTGNSVEFLVPKWMPYKVSR